MRQKKLISKSSFSQETIKRLSRYLRNLKRLQELGIDVVSSDKTSRFMNVTPEQFRKDLSYFGGFGKRGVGYNVGRLIHEIENILGIDKEWEIALVGVGRLGSALLEFEGFSQFNLKIKYAFDNDEKKIGKVRGGVSIRDVRQIKAFIRKDNIKMAILATPPEIAQEAADTLVAAGIRGILNFASVILRVPGHVSISNIDLACELESLIFFVRQNKEKTGHNSKGLAYLPASVID